jgi:hypothetical protein
MHKVLADCCEHSLTVKCTWKCIFSMCIQSGRDLQLECIDTIPKTPHHFVLRHKLEGPQNFHLESGNAFIGISLEIIIFRR